MAFYDSRSAKAKEYWQLPVSTLREIAQDNLSKRQEKRLATIIANQKDGLSKPPTLKQNRAKDMNYMIFALKGMHGTLGGMYYKCRPINTDCTHEEYNKIVAAIADARDAVTAALHCIERISKAKSKKQQKLNKEKNDALHSNL